MLCRCWAFDKPWLPPQRAPALGKAVVNSLRDRISRTLHAAYAGWREAPPAQSGQPAEEEHAILDAYATSAPSAQLAVDVFLGDWSSELPAELDATAGAVGLFADPRIESAIKWLGSDVDGMRILELGPLEGGHTYMLDRAGANVHAIESNSRAYLKCLVTKELLGLQRARISRGDFVAYLKDTDQTYDVVLASGVVYHMSDPVELLTLMSAVSDRLVIWTHYYDDEIVQNGVTANQFQKPAIAKTSGDLAYQLHPREYLEALKWGGFCGGPASEANWMEREDLLATLRDLGFDQIEIDFDEPHHPNGPSFLVMAQRTS
jgi:hypothetical protein